MRSFALSLAGAAAIAFLAAAPAQAEDKFTYMTNWYAQAEHGGFYQAQALGIYKKYGLDVTIKMGGPQVNITQMMAAGQADCIMGSSDIQMMQVREVKAALPGLIDQANAVVAKVPGLVKDLIGNGSMFPAIKPVPKG